MISTPGVGPVLPVGQSEGDDNQQDPGGKSADVPVHLQQCVRFALPRHARGDVPVRTDGGPLCHEQDDH